VDPYAGPALHDRPVDDEAVDRSGWYGVRCVFDHGDVAQERAYEERITLWQARSIDEAIELADAEATSYASDLEESRYLGLAQAFEMYDAPGSGAEVFSLIRTSRMPADDYLDAFFDTGAERQQTQG
jgi:hypothetical protein